MKAISDNLSPEEAWKRLSAQPRLKAESLHLEEAFDHILTSDLLAAEDVPCGPRSFRDGFAVNSKDVNLAPVSLRIVGDIAMGEIPSRPIGTGETMSIPTGGFLPNGAEAVVMVEDTKRAGDQQVLIQRKIAPGENVQKKGEDFSKGDLIFAAGHRLRSQDLAAIAMFGMAKVSIVRKPSIAMISTGNELVPYQSTEKHPGKIRETNSLAIVAAAEKFRFCARAYGIVADELEAQRSAMEKALAENDVVLISGGSSVGERDYTLEVIRTFPDSKIHFHGLSIRPGHPTIFASIGNHWVFGLPGHPVSSIVVFYLFVLPFLFHLSGETIEFAEFVRSKFHCGKAKLAGPIQPLKIKTDYARLRLQKDGKDWMAFPIDGKSASLSTISGADAFTIVSPGGAVIPAGETVEYVLFP